MRLVVISIMWLLGCTHLALTGSGSTGADRVDSCDPVDSCGPVGGHAGPAVSIALVGAAAGTFAFAIYRAITQR
jgi:hypothetical protein